MNTRRTLALQVRSDDVTDSGEVTATVAVWDRSYELMPGLHETIARGAFDDSLSNRESLPAYNQHSWRQGAAPIGVTTDYDTDGDGLTVKTQLWVEDNPTARDVHRALKAGALREWSIGFEADEIEWREDEDGEHAVITRGTMHEVSAVLKGASPFTSTHEVRETLVRAADPEAAAEELRAMRDKAVDLEEVREDDESDDDYHDLINLSRPEHRELVAARFSV